MLGASISRINDPFLNPCKKMGEVRLMTVSRLFANLLELDIIEDPCSKLQEISQM